jgi:hypothetical protein
VNEEREQEQYKEEKTSVCPMMDDRKCKTSAARTLVLPHPLTPLRRAENIGGATARRHLSQQVGQRAGSTKSRNEPDVCMDEGERTKANELIAPKGFA